MTIQEIVKILTDAGIEPNEANVEVKMLIEHFAGFGVKDILMGKKLDSKKLELVKEKVEYTESYNSYIGDEWTLVEVIQVEK